MRTPARTLLIAGLIWCAQAAAQQPCEVSRPTDSLTIPFLAGTPDLTTNPDSPAWRNAARATIVHDCSRKLDYPALQTEVRAFWTTTDVWFLFASPYKELNLFLPAQGGGPRLKLWDRDVVELFLGDDWERIRHYREFEIAPTGDWIDLAIDLDRANYDPNWRSGWKTMARIDEVARVWYAAARIPLQSVTARTVQPGTRWRMNLYRIDGLGADPQRHFLCWQPTCVQNRDPNHVPENFGTLVFGDEAAADLVTGGRKQFEARCAGCHGADGTGGERARGIGKVDRSRLQSDHDVRELIRRGLPESGMPPFPLPDSELDQLVAFVRSRVTPANQTPVTGNAELGKSYFYGDGRCSTCHMVNGRGGLQGPDLSDAGRRLTLAELEIALRDPAARRTRGYQVASVKLVNGATVRGFLKNESGFDYQIQGLDGSLHLLRREEVAELAREPGSLMPPLRASADVERGLLAFLARLPDGAAAGEAPTELPGAVRWDDVRRPKDGEWPTYHGTPGGNRHSALSQITPENVGKLALQWSFPVPGGRSLEVTPVVAGGVLYATAVNSVYALDARTGRRIWAYSRPPSKGLVGDAAGSINRGVAILGDRVFVVTDNAHLLALHRVTGSLLWDVEMADSGRHYGSTSAPLVVKDIVIAGVSGGDEGIRGFLSGYRVTTGERVWRFWTIPAPGEPLASTWVGRALEHGCGATWLTGTYDEETNLLFWPTGNPCPDYNGDERKGDNLYTDSVLALTPETGQLKWYYQFTPHDLHDWDATETPMVVNAEWGGRPRKLLLQGNRNGFFYVLDRTSGELLSATPFVKKLTWASGIGKDGRPVLAPGWQPTEEGTEVCPSVEGATNWMSTAYHPGTGLFYLMALEKCNVYRKSAEWWKQGESFYGGATWDAPGDHPAKYLRALDIHTGKIVWEYAQTGPAEGWGGLLTTASGLVFFADESGALAAANASTGKLLWHCQLNARWKASPMTFLSGGKQMIAIAAGTSIVTFALP